MAISLKHRFVSAKADGSDSTLVQPSNWNAEHQLQMATARIVGRTAAGDGAAEEISVGDNLSLASGVLNLTSTVSIAALTLSGTGALKLPVGTTAQRPTPTTGDLRFNSTLGAFEGYNGTEWGAVGGGVRPGILDPENRIINGAFDFWQRGTGFTASGYGADRWVNTVVGGTVTMSRHAFTIGDTLGSNSSAFCLRQAVSGQTLASHVATIQHRIEGVRSYAGQTITVLGWARRFSGAGNMAVESAQVFGTGGSPSPAVTGIGQPVTLTGLWAPFAVTIAVPSIAGRTLGTDGNDHLEINFWTSAGSDFNARSGSLGLQTIGVDLWGIHIKLGVHTTAAVEMYRAPELGPELARCQRYFAKSYDLNVNPATVTGVGVVEWWGANTFSFHNTTAYLPVEMRRVPGVALYSPATGAISQFRNLTGGADVAAATNRQGRRTFSLVVNNVSLTNVSLQAHYTADAEL